MIWKFPLLSSAASGVAALLLTCGHVQNQGITTQHACLASSRLWTTSFSLARQVPFSRPLIRWQHHVGRYAHDIAHYAHRFHVPAPLVAAVLRVENHGDVHHCAHRVSPAGAVGPMQLMPATAWDFLHLNPWNPRQNIRGGTQYLAYLLHRFHGNLRLAVLAYNAGPNAIAAGIRPRQSVVYAQEVLHWYRLFRTFPTPITL